MREAWDAWKKAVSLAWDHLLRLVVLNLLWVLVSVPVITVGPATLAAYWWVATGVREDQPRPFTDFFKGFLKFMWRGLVWSLGWAVVLGLAFTNLNVWAKFLPPLVFAIVEVAWLYGLIFLAVMQPYLLEDLTVDERPWWASLKRSAWHVMANPIYAHMHLVWPVAAVIIAAKTTTVLPIVLVSLVITFFSVAAAELPWRHGEPPPSRGRIEDVL